MRSPPRAMARIMSGSYPSSATVWARSRDATPKSSHDMISRSDRSGAAIRPERNGLTATSAQRARRVLDTRDERSTYELSMTPAGSGPLRALQRDVGRADGDAVDRSADAVVLAQRIADGGGDGGGDGDARRLADALGPERRLRVGLLDERRHDVGHVEERRQQVVGEAGVADAPVDLDDLLHHRKAQALRDPALDLTEHRQR